MMELEEHLRTLLWENDCVIIPRVGALIADERPARYMADEHLFLPPSRRLGFNAKVEANDGLLVQAYMRRHQLPYAEAAQRMEADVEAMLSELQTKGSLRFAEIGTFARRHSHISFEPDESGLNSPSLYGLDALSIAPLPRAERAETLYIPLKRQWIRQAAAVAAAVVLLFLCVTPLSNERGQMPQHASLGNFASGEQLYKMELITAQTGRAYADADREVSITPVASINRPIADPDAATPATVTTATITTAEPAADRPTEAATAIPTAPQPTATAEAATAGAKVFHVIIASLAKESSAQLALDEFAAKGYKECSVVHCDRRYRISYCSAASCDDAQRRLQELQERDARFKDAWILAIDPATGKTDVLH